MDESVLDYQRKRYKKAIEEFEKIFGESDVEIYSAPGRCEVGGNHTDHQNGMVLATSINQDALAVVGRSEDGMIHVLSDGYEMVDVDVNDLEERYDEEGTTAALVRGVAAELKARGYEVQGYNAYIVSDVLIGAGLSSSAAFEVILGTIISGLFNEGSIDPVVIAQTGQYAENVYFGKPCGLMDQCACSVGSLIHIDFQDNEHPIVNKIEVNFSEFKHSLCIVDVHASHADLTNDYASIPYEMKKVAQYFGKEVLRDVEEAEFYKKLPEVRTAINDRAVLRTIHLFEENKRVEKAVSALNDRDFDTFKKTIKASGESSFKYLQNIYSNHNTDQQAVSIALALSEDILGANGVCRIHGGGFAGTIQVFVEDEFVDTYQREIEKYFGEGSCHVLKVRKYGGMKVL